MPGAWTGQASLGSKLASNLCVDWSGQLGLAHIRSDSAPGFNREATEYALVLPDAPGHHAKHSCRLIVTVHLPSPKLHAPQFHARLYANTLCVGWRVMRPGRMFLAYMCEILVNTA